MTTWFTADLHFGHRNIIRYCNRPFGGVQHMDEMLVRNWNEVVQADDTVWVLGDVAMGSLESSLRLVGRLLGRKLLVAGNHDRCWTPHGRRAEGWTERYQEAGFAEVHQGTVELAVANTTVLACHFPYEGDSHDDDRYTEHRPVDRGLWLLHGHVHDTWAQRERMINVGVDVRNYRPMSEAAVADIIDQGRPPESAANRFRVSARAKRRRVDS